jgi:hypothetical protein
MPVPEITILHIMANPLFAGRGRGAFAVFSCDAGPIRMSGCTLVRRPDGRIDMYPPRTRAPRSCVMVRDEVLRAAIVQAACVAYGAAGGTLPAP